MGWLIRHIHNRDLAIENLTRAYVRRCFVLSAPTDILASLRVAVSVGGILLPPGSMLDAMTADKARRGKSAPGDYAVDVPLGRRGCRVADLRGAGEDAAPDPAAVFLRAKITTLCRTMTLGRPKLQHVEFLSSAVHLNGRPYKEGDYFQYLHSVPRTRWRDAQDPTYVGVGRISQMSWVETATNEEGCVFFSFHPVKVLRHEGNMVVLHRAESVLPDNVMDCIHVDSVVFKLRVIQSDDDPEVSFGIRMWEAR